MLVESPAHHVSGTQNRGGMRRSSSAFHMKLRSPNQALEAQFVAHLLQHEVCAEPMSLLYHKVPQDSTEGKPSQPHGVLQLLACSCLCRLESSASHAANMHGLCNGMWMNGYLSTVAFEIHTALPTQGARDCAKRQAEQSS